MPEKATMTKLVPLDRLDGDQVINIPKEMEFETDEVVIYRVGEKLIIEPRQLADRSSTLE